MKSDKLYRTMIKEYLDSKGYGPVESTMVSKDSILMIERFLTLEKNKELENIALDIQAIKEQIKKG